MKHETERLYFRIWTPDDAQAAYEIYSDPEVLRYLGESTLVESVEAQRQRFVDSQDRYTGLIQQGLGVWAVVEKSTGTPIGTALYKFYRNSKHRLNEPEKTEIGWHLARSRWGMGYGTEIAAKLFEISMAKEGSARACAFPENLASIRIMEKIGLKFQGKITDFYDIELDYFEAKII